MTTSAAQLAVLLNEVITPVANGLDQETTAAILDEAQKFADRLLVKQAVTGDREGCRLVDGRVKTPSGHREAWRAYAESGWVGLTAPQNHGGQALSMTLASAVQELFDAADPAFGMLAINARCATRLLQRHGDDSLCNEWLPQLAQGNWAATICISEPQAGSDVGRIRTRAVDQGDGHWRITGQKCWISFGDHDLTERIGHFILARPVDAPAGSRGLSLYLVPDTLDEAGRNGVSVIGLEQKLGLHASPTCGLAFDEAIGYPIGEQGRGLSTLFAMIESMRLAVAVQGAATAQAALVIAGQYARERRQGGGSATPPVPISEHAEVQRLLLSSRVRADAARLIALETAAAVDLADAGDHTARERAGLLLPLAKSFGAKASFANADAAIQVLGGAGYVNDWPVERMLRDCRVFSIYEGTTAIQGIDLLQRRILAGEGQDALQRLIVHFQADTTLAGILTDTITALTSGSPGLQQAAAVPLLEMLGIVVSDALLRRAADRAGPMTEHYAALAQFHADEAPARCELLAERCKRGDVAAAFERIYY